MRYERETGPAPISFEQVAHLAREALLRDGHHAPTLIVDGSTGFIVVQFDALASTFEGRAQQMFAAGQVLAREGHAGRLRGVYFVSEAWLSRARYGRLPDVPPSQDPHRTEVLVVSRLGASASRAQVATYEMIRDEQGKLREIREISLPEAPSVSADSPLLEAFLTGFWTEDGLR